MEKSISLLASKLTRVEGTRNPEFSGKLTMDSNIKIKGIEKHKPAAAKNEALKVSYMFSIDYSDLGKVEIEGILFIGADSKVMKEIMKAYETKKFETPEILTIMNLIIQKASVRAFEIEEELQLPIHIKLPSLSPKK